MSTENKDEILEESAAEEAAATEAEAETAESESDKKIAELEKELAASKEAHIRTLAEYDNFRKRSAKERESFYADAKALCIAELLPILDNFDRALLIQESDVESYKKGMEMINASFVDTLKKLGVEAFGEAGEEFDPNFHNAVLHIENEELGENVIAQVFSKGYKIGDKVLRPAMVQVAN